MEKEYLQFLLEFYNKAISDEEFIGTDSQLKKLATFLKEDNKTYCFQYNGKMENLYYIPQQRRELLMEIKTNGPVLNSSFSTVKYLIPNKRREEILGDLIETKLQMIRDRIPFWKIKIVLNLQFLLIVFSVIRIRLSDFGTSKKIEKH